jgi:anti-sigma factor RsiW
MSDHLSASLLNGLVDRELSPEELTAVQAHLTLCSTCASEALAQTLLKNAVATTAKRYEMSSEFRDRMNRLISVQTQQPEPQKMANSPAVRNRMVGAIGYSGWAAAAILLLILTGSFFIERSVHRSEMALVSERALAAEASDLHVATLAANQPLQVFSSDRHTVKPWFEGKIPFAFNLPENLPEDTKLEGANLAFLRGAPVAQLIYTVGRHRASVFVRARTTGEDASNLLTEHSGFQIAGFDTADLDVIGVTDADRVRLLGLISAFKKAQPGAPTK